jgi:Cu-processing system permease protein
MNKITRFVITDIIRNKIVILYALLLAALSWGVFSMEDNVSKGMLTILNLILLNVPLVAVIFSTIYLYNSSEFIELLLSQPVKRSRIWWSLFSGLQLALFMAFVIGAGIPVLIFSPDLLGITMLLVGVMVNAIFVALAFLGSIMTRDKAKGIGMAIMLWLFFALLFDGLVLFLLFQFSDYPIEKFMVIMSTLSPIDLSRILVLLQMDVSAMMGYSGAIFREFFGTGAGIGICFTILLLWIAIPFLISLRKFNRKDL